MGIVRTYTRLGSDWQSLASEWACGLEKKGGWKLFLLGLRPYYSHLSYAEVDLIMDAEGWKIGSDPRVRASTVHT